MNLRRKHRIIVLCAIGLLFCAVYWMLQEREPTYQGKTAQEWFDARVAGEINDTDYLQSLEALDSNFFPVLTNALDSRYRLAESLYQKAPHWIQDRCQFIVTNRQQRNLQAHYTFAIWRNIRVLDLEVKKLKAILASSPFAFQSQYIPAICMAETGNTNFAIKPDKKYLSHPEFIVRLYVAQLLTRGPSRQPEVQLQCVPVLLEAVTDSVLVVNTYGNGARVMQKTALEHIRKISPETAAEFSKYLK